nr:MAG: putative structural protein [Heilongjiang sediment hepe-like virus 1]
MSGVSNPVDLDMYDSLHRDNEIQTFSASMSPKQSFLHKTLHPPSAIPGYLGMPTNDARSQVVVNWRSVNMMNKPIIADFTSGKTRYVTPTDLESFDIAFLVPNGARVQQIAFINNATINRMDQDYNNTILQDNYNFKNWQEDARLYRFAYGSTTTYLNATAFNNIGMVSVAQFNPSILFSGTLITFAEEMSYKFIKFIKDTRKCSSTLSSQMELHPSFPKFICDELNQFKSVLDLNIDPNTTIQVINFGSTGLPVSTIVPTNTQINAMSMRSYTGLAKEGTFSISRNNTISPEWLTATNTSPSNLAGLYQCYYYNIDASGLPHFIPFKENADVGVTLASAPTLKDTLWSKDSTWTWYRYSGLSMNPNTSTSTSMLITKNFRGFEIQPCAASAWSGMMQLGPKPDLEAMQALMDAFYELKDGMPARYNFWGVIADIAMQGAKTFGTAALGYLVNKAGDLLNKPKTTKPVKNKAKAIKSKIAVKENSLEQKVNSLTKQLNSINLKPVSKMIKKRKTNNSSKMIKQRKSPKMKI